MTKICTAFLIFLTLELLWNQASGIKWLALARSSSIAATIKEDKECNDLNGLVKKQKKICKKHVEMMGAVQKGAIDAIGECQFQFRNRRWNCSTVNASTIFGNVLDQGTREASFVHAISSAGVAHAVTRACSLGSMSECGCDRTVRGRSPAGFEWAGCSDNIAFGTAFSRTFVDARERVRKDRDGSSSRVLMNLHNNEAGRKIIEENMLTQCKCHGVSGSCELKTCWRAMPSFRKIGYFLKEKFDGACEVQQKKTGSRSVLVPRSTQYKPHSSTDLVYLVASPDFCERDQKTGALGTHGRRCNKTSKAIDGCELMCCGRGYVTKRRIIIERCHCKFHWCCYVKCQNCKREVEEHTCL